MRRWTVVLVVSAGLGLGFLLERKPIAIDAPLFQRQVSPGPLSVSHAWLEGNCAACHTALQSAEAAKCIGCHATDINLLQRQPTAFHAAIGACSRCHVEHQGSSPRPVAMDHATLADIRLEAVREDRDDPSNRRLLAWIDQHDVAAEIAPTHPKVTSEEAALDCAACHSTKDRHQGYFGGDCAACHGTSSWTIEEFRHPSPSSVECVQCHQAPPSHFMMHFEMVSKRVAGEHDARVDQCFECHQTTSWNDIRRAGWYKHH
ncbi:MAG: hypothetical protein DCC71_03780 [Proteobacteria bacterium]|nr:MAG: hypothetical protein DCC71_03780 [Pseudomonadota bacterium]